MQIICVSRGSQSRGHEFAEKLAAKLGYECVSREQLLEEATRRKIPIGKLETTVIKPHLFSKELARELEHYKAVATSILCEKALNHNIVYHGRTGHLLLPGVEHVLKIRVVSDIDYRVQYVMRQFNLPRDKAREYIERVEEDRRKWVRQFYNVEWDVFTLYDLVLNLSQINVDNAAAATCSIAELPEFKATPASIGVLQDLDLAARARLILASNPKTHQMNIQVKAINKVVHLIYLSHEVDQCSMLNEMLTSLHEAREIVCTKAETTILWIQEVYSVDSESYGHVVALARTWGAAIELIKMIPAMDEEPDEIHSEGQVSQVAPSWNDSGIMDDDEGTVPHIPEDISKVYEMLIRDGKAGGLRTVKGSQKTLMNAINRSVNYRLIILDNMFQSKGEAARKRLQREWANVLSDSLKTPVISLDEMVSKYHFGPKQATQLITLAALTVFIVYVIFRFQDGILSFFLKDGTEWRILEAVCITAFVPLFAFVYGTVTGLFLKMIKLD
jgi:cytidylate kinase